MLKSAKISEDGVLSSAKISEDVVSKSAKVTEERDYAREELEQYALQAARNRNNINVLFKYLLLLCLMKTLDMLII